MSPTVSVIVSTINWSAVLRCALLSIQGQTFQDFEVLVVGDACTDDSGDVVASFRDERFRWHNLDTNHGSQSGPNNHGLRTAKGEWIAYLGHDDIWHPDHLAGLLQTAERTGLKAAVATVLLFGSPESGAMSIGGAVPGEVLSPIDWVPPSGWMHRRDIVETAGYWQDRKSISLPVDIDFFSRIRLETAVAATHDCTVFKFDASSRRDAYLHRDIGQQAAMLKKMAEGGDFRAREMQKAFQAHSRGLLNHLETPFTTDRLPGEISDGNLRFRGLKPWFAPEEMVSVKTPQRFSMDRQVGGDEWHFLEDHPTLGSFRWSGPSPRSSIDLPVEPSEPLHVTVRLLRADAVQFSGLAVSVDRRQVETTMHDNPDGTRDLTFTTEPSSAGHLRITFEAPLFRPIELGTNADRRLLGIAVMFIEVSALD